MAAHTIAGALLQICRDHPDVLRDAYQRGLVTRARAMRAPVIEHLRNLAPTGVLAASGIAWLAGALRQVEQACGGAEEGPRATLSAARAGAEALDAALGDHYARLYEHAGDWELPPDRPYPVIQAPLKELFHGRLSTHPERLVGLTVDQTTRLALAPRLPGMHLRLSFEVRNALRAPDGDTAIGFVYPMDEADEIEPVNAPDRPGFRVRHRDPERNAERLVERLEAARAGGASILIVPELAVSSLAVERTRAWLRAHGDPPDLVVCGSVHEVTGGVPRNAATTFVGAGREVVHHKFNPYDVDGVFEAIEVTPRVMTIYATIDGAGVPTWSFATLVCKDFLDPVVVDRLRDLRAACVLVPAMSEETHAFESNAVGLAGQSQAVTAVANHTTRSDAAMALLTRPLRASALQRIERGDQPAPVVIVPMRSPYARVERWRRRTN